jgi:hypothetical protein
MMRPAFDHTGWSVLSHLLRCAQQEGWQVAFHPGRVEIAGPAHPPGIVTLPAALLRSAREAGWTARPTQPAALALRHPAVRENVDLLIGGSRTPR